MLNQVADKESMKNRRKTAGWDDDYFKSTLSKINAIEMRLTCFRIKFGSG
jgi:hypothetical protein